MGDRPATNWLKEWDFAHRGMHYEGVPENSFDAAGAALVRDLGIECDIQLSRDGVPVVFHDWDLRRLTGQERQVCDTDAAELFGLQLLGTDSKIYPLASLLSFAAGKVPLLIEIKSRPDFDIDHACAAISGVLGDYSGEHAVMSFDPRMGTWFARHDPDRVRGLVGTDRYDNGFLGVWRDQQALAAAQPDFLALDIRDLPNPAAVAWRASGKPLLTWTVSTPELRARAQQYADAPIAEGEGLAESDSNL